MDLASPGELRSRHPPPRSSGSPTLPAAAKVTFQRAGERPRDREREEGADRNISGYETAAVCLSPSERCAASGVSLPAAGATSRENTKPKNMLSQAPGVSAHKLESGEVPHACSE